ncbi:MAG TPA: hypothetical protein VLT90_00130 [Terriglobales bacterium]|nr:hypothetical protein [Terriglobales bacterium]
MATLDARYLESPSKDALRRKIVRPGESEKMSAVIPTALRRKPAVGQRHALPGAEHLQQAVCFAHGRSRLESGRLKGILLGARASVLHIITYGVRYTLLNIRNLLHTTGRIFKKS